METLPQLYMRNFDLSLSAPLITPSDIHIICHNESLTKLWESLIEKAYNTHFSFTDCIIHSDSVGGFEPKNTLYLQRKDKIVATATAVENSNFPGEGWFRMIASDPEERGKGYGKLICLAALHSLAERNYKTAVLSTDDYRIPAIRMYLSLGFEPIYTHKSHEERWEKVFEIINNLK